METNNITEIKLTNIDFQPGSVLRAAELNVMVDEIKNNQNSTETLEQKIETICEQTGTNLGEKPDDWQDPIDRLETVEEGSNANAANILTLNSTVATKPGEKITDSVGGERFNDYAHNIASGEYSHAEGFNTQAITNYCHAEGGDTVAGTADKDKEGNPIGRWAHAEGYGSQATANGAHAEGNHTTASGNYSHSEGYYTMAKGNRAHTEGERTIAAGYCQHVQGKFNIEDTSNKYAHIVGNGTGENGTFDSKGQALSRSNAHTLDWDGNAWFKGNVEANSFVLFSPNGTRYKIIIQDDGDVKAVEYEYNE